MAATKTTHVTSSRWIWDLFLTKLTYTLEYHQGVIEVAFSFVRIVIYFALLFVELIRLHGDKHPKKFFLAFKCADWVSRIFAIKISRTSAHNAPTKLSGRHS